MPHPSDRRSSLLELTEDGERLADAAERTFAETVPALLAAAFEPATMHVVADGLARLRTQLQAEGVGTPAG